MMKFETERLEIREFNDNDLDNLYHLLSDSEVMKYCSGPLNFKQSQKWLKSIKEYYNKIGYDYWIAVHKTTREFIGQMGIIQQKVDDEWIDCIAFMISKNKWGKGYATEGAKGCIIYGMEVLKLKRIYATVEKNNTVSKKILDKIGMKYKGEAVCFNKKIDLYSIY